MRTTRGRVPTVSLMLVRDDDPSTGWLRITWSNDRTHLEGSLGVLATGSNDAVDLSDPWQVLAWARRQRLGSIRLAGSWPEPEPAPAAARRVRREGIVGLETVAPRSPAW